METSAYRKHAIVPKTRGRKRRFIPSLPPDDLQELIGRLAPAERRALEQIAETSDLLKTDAGDFLLVPADEKLVDVLAAVGAEAEDRENDLEDEADEGMEDDRVNDNAFELANFDGWGNGQIVGELEPEDPAETAARAKIAEERRVPARNEYEGQTYSYSRYDACKDFDEVRRIRRAVFGLGHKRWRRKADTAKG